MDPATLAHSTVSIMRHFDDKEMEARPGVLGVRATGWFLSPMLMATVEHVTAAMHLSDRDWKHVEIGKGESKQSIPARIRHLAGPSPYKIALVELQTAFAGAQGFSLRMESLVPEEPVVSLAYPDGVPRVAGGRFVQYGDGSRLAGSVLLEMDVATCPWPARSESATSMVIRLGKVYSELPKAMAPMVMLSN